jgi:hypothetical protein
VSGGRGRARGADRAPGAAGYQATRYEDTGRVLLSLISETEAAEQEA